MPDVAPAVADRQRGLRSDGALAGFYADVLMFVRKKAVKKLVRHRIGIGVDDKPRVRVPETDAERERLPVESTDLPQRERRGKEIHRPPAGLGPAAADPRADVEAALRVIGEPRQRQARLESVLRRVVGAG